MAITIALFYLISFFCNDFFKMEMFGFHFIIMSFLCCELYKRYDIIIGVNSFLISIISSSSVWLFKLGAKDIPKIVNRKIDLLAHKSDILIMSSMFLLVFYKERRNQILRICDYLFLLNAPLLLYGIFFKIDHCGVFRNVGVSAIFAVIYSPCYFQRNKINKVNISLIPLYGLCFLLKPIVTANLSLMIIILVCCFHNRKVLLTTTFLFMGIVTAIGIQNGVLSDSTRFLFWPKFIDFMFKPEYNFLTGMGPGSFWVYGPAIQGSSTWKTIGGYVFAHNEYIQYAFEFGLIPFISMMISIPLLIFKTSSVHSKAMMIAYCFSMITWPMFRYNPLAILGVIIIGELYYGENVGIIKRKVQNNYLQ